MTSVAEDMKTFKASRAASSSTENVPIRTGLPKRLGKEYYFSEGNWGDQMRGFMKSIQNLGLRTWTQINTEAKKYVTRHSQSATHAIPHMRYNDASNTDARAMLVDSDYEDE